MELDDLLKGSFPKPGNADRIRALFDDDIRADRNALGLMPRREQGTIHITYPVAVFAWNA